LWLQLQFAAHIKIDRRGARVQLQQGFSTAATVSPADVVPLQVRNTNLGQKTTGQNATRQKTTKNANPGQKATGTIDHPDKKPPSLFSLKKS